MLNPTSLEPHMYSNLALGNKGRFQPADILISCVGETSCNFVECLLVALQPLACQVPYSTPFLFLLSPIFSLPSMFYSSSYQLFFAAGRGGRDSRAHC